MKKLLLFSFIALVALGCKKDPGKGGKATLYGQVEAKYYCDDNGSLLEVSGAAEQRVYLTYGNNTHFDDDTRANEEGLFSFNYLNPGQYTLTTFSECKSCPSGSIAIKQNIEIGKKDKNIEVSKFSIDNYSGRACPIDSLKGTASISGMLQAIYIDENNYDTIKVEPLPNERIFIAKGSELTQFDDVRSSADGTFRFLELPVGDFQLYAYSECIVCNAGIEAKVIKVSISSATDKLNTGTLSVVVYKKR